MFNLVTMLVPISMNMSTAQWVLSVGLGISVSLYLFTRGKAEYLLTSIALAFFLASVSR